MDALARKTVSLFLEGSLNSPSRYFAMGVTIRRSIPLYLISIREASYRMKLSMSSPPGLKELLEEAVQPSRIDIVDAKRGRTDRDGRWTCAFLGRVGEIARRRRSVPMPAERSRLDIPNREAMADTVFPPTETPTCTASQGRADVRQRCSLPA